MICGHRSSAACGVLVHEPRDPAIAGRVLPLDHQEEVPALLMDCLMSFPNEQIEAPEGKCPAQGHTAGEVSELTQNPWSDSQDSPLSALHCLLLEFRDLACYHH